MSSYQPRPGSSYGGQPMRQTRGAPIRQTRSGPQPINKSAMDNMARDYDIDKDKKSRNIMVGIATVSVLGKLLFFIDYLFCYVMHGYINNEQTIRMMIGMGRRSLVYYA